MKKKKQPNYVNDRSADCPGDIEKFSIFKFNKEKRGLKEITQEEIKLEAKFENLLTKDELKEIEKMERNLDEPVKQKLEDKIFGVLIWIEGAKEVIKAKKEGEIEEIKQPSSLILSEEILEGEKFEISKTKTPEIDFKIKDFFVNKLQQGLKEEKEKSFTLFQPQPEIEEDLFHSRPKYIPDIYFKTNIDNIYITKKRSEVVAKGERIKKECYYLEILSDQQIKQLKEYKN